MQTNIKEKKHPDAAIAEQILRSCVHCGFCNATCPTYQLEGIEQEGPRGRIYLIKGVLEDSIPLSRKVVSHLDSCLSCLSCETTCPSGVRYSHLIDSARHRIETTFSRSFSEKLNRKMLAWLLPNPGWFRLALRLGKIGKLFAFLMPGSLAAMVRMIPLILPRPSSLSKRRFHLPDGKRRARVALLTGCAQQVLGPEINEASIRLLTRLGCEVIIPPDQKCCGALVFHMGNHHNSLGDMKRNIDLWYSELSEGKLDYIVINTSGCGVVVKDYGHIFRDDKKYRDKAKVVAEKSRDITEVIEAIGMPKGTAPTAEGVRVAYHDACSLQHGQKIRELPRQLLAQAGFQVMDIPQGHLCCGSAGTYNMLHPHTAKALGEWKRDHIDSVDAQLVAAGNIGCMEQISSYSKKQVFHTVQLLDWATGGPRPPGVR